MTSDNFHGAVKQLRIFAVVMAVFFAVSIASNIIFSGQASSSASHAAQSAMTAQHANAKALEAKEIALAVASERRDSVRESCDDTNATHRNTIRRLDQILSAAERATPSRVRLIKASRVPTVLLINALAPYRDCKAYVRQHTTQKG